MRTPRSYSLLAALAAAAVLAVMFHPAGAVTDANIAVVHAINPLGALITNTARAPATVNGADQPLGSYLVVRCTYDQTAHVGSPSTAISIQNKDPVSGKYETLVSSSGITADDTPTSISAGVGLATTANVSAGVPVAATWRVIEVITTATSTTGKVACELSK